MKIISVYILALMALVVIGCDGTIEGTVDEEYTVDGLLFHNPEENSSFCYALIFREGEPIEGLLTYAITGPQDSVQLAPIGNGGYQTVAGSLTLEPNKTYHLRADEPFGEFFFSEDLKIADTFRITVTGLPANRHYSGGSVGLDWNAPSPDFDYFVTVVPPSSEVAPYSSFDTESVPAEAFYNSGDLPVPGKYRIYIVAYDETFYSNGNLEPDLIFFPYPSEGFPDNVDKVGISGKLGAAILSYHDSVVVNR